ncbi:DNA-directed RNA polymerase IV subunit 1 DNA-directed RNA polymerase D subunit 1 [Vigna angularis]|uniref:DNA-directed RNA polymerase n=1 Tax=Phaseolus angularis TaxID=3914 RepID=A0A8T0JJS9_PHAAN|nr:DNA-directed RNA polymerase IV subunit 1 DNA-directed RNA polymerase D subunit 1 [Vigna angularis]
MHDILFPSHHVSSPISHFAVIALVDSEKQIKVVLCSYGLALVLKDIGSNLSVNFHDSDKRCCYLGIIFKLMRYGVIACQLPEAICDGRPTIHRPQSRVYMVTSNIFLSKRLSSSMDDEFFYGNKAPSGVIKAIKFDVLTENDIEKVSVLEINAAGQVTGSMLGFPNISDECATCGSKDKKFCEGVNGHSHFGVIKFPFPVLHPYFMSEIAQILNKICPVCKTIRHKSKGNGMGRYPSMKFKFSSNDLYKRTAIIVEVNDKVSKKTLGRSLPADYWDFIPYDAQQEENYLNRRVLSPGQLNPDKTPNTIFADIQKKKVAENACNSSGLRWIKDVVLGKRNDSTFRAVVVGDPYLELSEIGIPCHIAESLHVSEYVNRQNLEKLLYCCELRLLEKGAIKVCRKGSSINLFKKEDLRIGDQFYRPLCDGDKVLINRPPSIHQHSMIALTVRVLPISSVVCINPLCCSPFRGDFDGDCLHGYIPQSVSARVELNELVALDRQLFNGQSGRNLLSLSEDSLTAAYLLMEDGVLLDVYQMQQLQMLCNKGLAPPGIVKAPSSKSSFWSGKQLFSMLLPSDFGYSFSSDGVVVSDGELLSSFEASGWLRDSDCNVFQSLVEHFQGKSLNFLFAAQNVLCEWLSMIGFSVSLSDLYLSSDSYARKNMIEEILYGLQDAEKACDFKQLLLDCYCDFLSGNHEESENSMIVDADNLNNERQISAALSQASVDAFRHVFRNIQSLADKYACTDNTFLAMNKAGSKSSLVRLAQHSMCLGMQNSLVRLSYRLPRHLSCSAWNSEKGLDSIQKYSGTLKSVQSYIPCAVVKSSFLTGLNPLECFVHSVATRASGFSENADVPGTLTRRLMFFMRDLFAAYDGTVRNLYGNQLIQFSYDIEENSSCDQNLKEYAIGGEPVGALSASAVSEAGYSALDQPVSLLETSPLLNLKNVLECGSRKKKGDQSVTLFLSEKVGKQRHGFEYAALEVKNYLERLFFSKIVSTVMIIFTPHDSRSLEKGCPWYLLSLSAILGASEGYNSICNYLYSEFYAFLKCSGYSAVKEGDDTFVDNKEDSDDCITVTVVENSENPIQLVSVRDLMIPFFLGTTIKGFMDIKKVDILWNNQSKVTNSYSGSSGELYLRVTVASDGNTGRFWGVLVNHCHKIMQIIDWPRSHPDSISYISSAFGIDVAWQYYYKSLASAICDTGKSILPKHLRLLANSLSASGEFVGLNAKGMALQREHASVSSPFVQACFSNPGRSFIKAAKSGITDNLRGSLDALAWGNCPSLGTSGLFDIIYSEKIKALFNRGRTNAGPLFTNYDEVSTTCETSEQDPTQGAREGYEVAKSVDVYKLLEASFDKPNNKIGIYSHNNSSDKCGSEFRHKNGYAFKEGKQWKNIVRNFVTVNDIQKLTIASRCILNKYAIDELISEFDRSTMLRVLNFHPRRSEKLGIGPQDIKVGWHPKFTDSRCFHIVRTDGTVEDFSYRKCILGALEIVDPKMSKIQKKKWSGRDDTNSMRVQA